MQRIGAPVSERPASFRVSDHDTRSALRNALDHLSDVLHDAVGDDDAVREVQALIDEIHDAFCAHG